MTTNTSDSIDDLIELLSNADQGDRLSIDLPDAPTDVVEVVSNDSVAPTDDPIANSPEARGKIQVNATVDYDYTPVAEPGGSGTSEASPRPVTPTPARSRGQHSA